MKTKIIMTNNPVSLVKAVALAKEEQEKQLMQELSEEIHEILNGGEEDGME